MTDYLRNKANLIHLTTALLTVGNALQRGLCNRIVQNVSCYDSKKRSILATIE